MEPIDEFKKLLADNMLLQQTVGKRVIRLENKIKLLEEARFSLLHSQSFNICSQARRAPIRCLQNSAVSNKSSAKHTEKKSFLNTHVTVVPRRGRIDNPFIDAGLYASLQTVRVQFKSVPLNTDAMRIASICQLYDVFGHVFHSSCLKWENVIERYTSRQPTQQSEETTLLTLNARSDGKKIFHDFLRTEKVQKIISQYWGDIHTLRERICTEYSNHFLIHLPLYSSNRVIQLLRVYHVMEDPYLKFNLKIVRAKRVSNIRLTCTNDVLFEIKKIQFKSIIAHRRHCKDSIIHYIAALIMSMSGALSYAYEEILEILTVL